MPFDFNNYTKDQLMELVYVCSTNLRTFAYTFLPEIFVANSHFYDDAFDALDLIDKGKIENLAIEGSRGIGKTSIILAWLTRRIILRKAHYIVMASARHDLAVKDSTALRNTLITSELIKKFFGVFKPTDYETDFSKDNWITAASPQTEKFRGHPGTMVTPVSWEMSVRGLHFTNSIGKFRPDIRLADDMENPKIIKSDVQRAAIDAWFWGDFRNMGQMYEGARNKYEFPSALVVVGSYLGEDCLIRKAIKNSAFEHVQLAICSEDLKSNAPELISTETLKKERQAFAEAGQINMWYMERVGSVIDEFSDFNRKHFTYYTMEDLKGKYYESVVILDPAKTTKDTSAETAIVGWSFVPDEGIFYLRDIIHGNFDPVMIGKDGISEEYIATDSLKAAFEMGRMIQHPLSKCKMAFEVTGLGLYIEYPMRSYNQAEGYNCELIPINAVGDKKERIRTLAYFYRMGLIKHIKPVCDILEDQLLRLNTAAKVDVADASAHVLQVFGKGKRLATFKQPLLTVRDTSVEEKFRMLRVEQARRLGVSKRCVAL